MPYLHLPVQLGPLHHIKPITTAAAAAAATTHTNHSPAVAGAEARSGDWVLASASNPNSKHAAIPGTDSGHVTRRGSFTSTTNPNPNPGSNLHSPRGQQQQRDWDTAGQGGGYLSPSADFDLLDGDDMLLTEASTDDALFAAQPWGDPPATQNAGNPVGATTTGSSAGRGSAVPGHVSGSATTGNTGGSGAAAGMEASHSMQTIVLETSLGEDFLSLFAPGI